MNWKIIRSHVWTDDTYTQGIKHLENKIENKENRNFKERMKYYKIIYENSWPVKKKSFSDRR